VGPCICWWSTPSFVITILNLFFIASILSSILSLIGAADRTHQISNTEVTGVDEQSLPIYTVLVPVYKEPEVTDLNSGSEPTYPLMKTGHLNLIRRKRFSYYKARSAHPPATSDLFIFLIVSLKPSLKPVIMA